MGKEVVPQEAEHHIHALHIPAAFLHHAQPHHHPACIGPIHLVMVVVDGGSHPCHEQQQDEVVKERGCPPGPAEAWVRLQLLGVLQELAGGHLVVGAARLQDLAEEEGEVGAEDVAHGGGEKHRAEAAGNVVGTEEHAHWGHHRQHQPEHQKRKDLVSTVHINI